MGELATLARLRAIDDRIDKIGEAIECLKADVALLAEKAAEAVEHFAKIDELIASIRERQGLQRETITVPPPPKILRDIGLIPPEPSVERGSRTVGE